VKCQKNPNGDETGMKLGIVIGYVDIHHRERRERERVPVNCFASALTFCNGTSDEDLYMRA
jgi:hypothetical protein